MAALKLSENPTKFLSTVQIGITLIGILLGVYSGENLTNDVEGFLASFENIRPYSHSVAVTVIVVFVTYLSIVLGELLRPRLFAASLFHLSLWSYFRPIATSTGYYRKYEPQENDSGTQ